MILVGDFVPEVAPDNARGFRRRGISRNDASGRSAGERAELAVARGDRSLLNFSRSTPGSIPPDISPGIFEDALRYGKFQLLMAHSDKTIQQFQGGIRRPYLVISSSDAESAKSLRNFSEIMPSSSWAWWAPSRLMVIPLLDDADLVNPNSNIPGNSGSPTNPGNPGSSGTQPANPSAGGGPTNPGAGTSPGTSSGTSPGNSGTSGAATSGSGTLAQTSTAGGGTTSGSTTITAPTTAGTGTTTVVTPTNTGQTPGAVSGSQAATTRPSSTGCVHPGNGHAFRRCNH
jgi:hypothetical protein